MTPDNEVSLRQFFQLLIDERDRRYEDRFRGIDEAVKSALAAQKELTSVSFASSEKAIVKAEEAQREYNIRSNEFRGQLDDQAKLLLPRSEAAARFDNLDEKIDEIKKDILKRYDDIRTEITSLREFRSEIAAHKETTQDTHQDDKWRTGITISVALTILGMIITFIYFMVGK